MWEAQLTGKAKFKVNNLIGSRQRWYSISNQYWTAKTADYNGMMGGFGNLHHKDINFSKKFIGDVTKILPKMRLGKALDCGAGIGRISKELLVSLFMTVDIVDQCQKHVQRAQQILKNTNVRHYYCKGLQNFNFEDKYDCIWVQWVLGYLNDEDGMKFLRRARKNLNQGGMIVIKDNVADRGFFVDKEDCSVIRSSILWKSLFERAGLTVISEDIQLDWPKDMFNLRIYALV